MVSELGLDAFRDGTEIGERPLSIKYHGEYGLCDEVRGLSEQFYAGVKDFALRQGLEQFWKYFELPEGGYIKAQYGPNKLQLIDIFRDSVIPGKEKEKEEEKFPEVSEEYDEDHCRQDVLIALSTEAGMYPANMLKTVYGRNEDYPFIKYVGDGYPFEYEIYLNVDTEEDGHGRLTRNALFFEVVEKKRNKHEDRHRPVTLPFPCFKCYEWELEGEIGDCDGQLISTAEQLAAFDWEYPCDAEEWEVHNHEGWQERKDTGKGKSKGQPDYTAEGVMRWKPGLIECFPHDGTYAWFVNVKYEPDDRCPDSPLLLNLWNKKKTKLLHSVPINIIKVSDKTTSSYTLEDNTGATHTSETHIHEDNTYTDPADLDVCAAVCVNLGGFCTMRGIYIYDYVLGIEVKDLWKTTVNECTGESTAVNVTPWCWSHSFYSEYSYSYTKVICEPCTGCNREAEGDWTAVGYDDTYDCYVPPGTSNGNCCG